MITVRVRLTRCVPALLLSRKRLLLLAAVLLAAQLGLGAAPATAQAQAALGSISGTVWFDMNRNGIREPEEPAMAGMAITLQQVSPAPGAMSARVITDQDGTFIFPSLPYGAYQISDETGYTVEVTLDEMRGVQEVSMGSPGHLVFLPLAVR